MCTIRQYLDVKRQLKTSDPPLYREHIPQYRIQTSLVQILLMNRGKPSFWMENDIVQSDKIVKRCAMQNVTMFDIFQFIVFLFDFNHTSPILLSSIFLVFLSISILHLQFSLAVFQYGPFNTTVSLHVKRKYFISLTLQNQISFHRRIKANKSEMLLLQ